MTRTTPATSTQQGIPGKPPKALLLEDDRGTRERATELLHSLGFDVDATDSVERAEGWIRVRPGGYAIALVDWDMTKSSDTDRMPSADARQLTAAPVLDALSSTAPWTRTLVWAGRLGVIATQATICRAHPGALLHDKSLGEGSLVDRVRKLVGCRVGDLELDRGLVRHAPSGDELVNRLAPVMLLAHPHWVHVPHEDRALQSLLFRFRRWLREVESDVEVVLVDRANRYSLRLREDG